MGSGKKRFTYRLPEPAKAHTLLKIPGSHTLYAGPPACMRRHALSAREHGLSSSVSFLSVTEADVALGSFEALIHDAVGELAKRLAPAPKVFVIAVFCIDDLIGTDEKALIATLTQAYPAFQFAVERIDPISLSSARSMSADKQSGLYSFIKPSEDRDDGINFLGNFVPLESECEIFDLLRLWGCAPVRELFRCKSFEEYQTMGRSRAAVVLRFIAEEAARRMRNRLGIPYCVMQPAYDPEEIVEGYSRLAAVLQKECPALGEKTAAAQEDMAETAAMLGGMPLAIDAKAFLTPFSAAKALLRAGFEVRYIFRAAAAFDTPSETEAEAFIKESYPEVKVFRMGSSRRDHAEKEASELLAIGSYCAESLDARFFADVWHDEGYFGFHGIHRLMALLRSTAGKEAPHGIA